MVKIAFDDTRCASLWLKFYTIISSNTTIMRTTTFCMLLLWALAGCGRQEGSGVEGIYVRTEDNAILHMEDTLEVRPTAAGAGGTFDITSRSYTTYKQPEDTVLNKRRTRTINARYDGANRVLETEDPGLRYVLSDDGSLRTGEIIFRKLP